jgi:tetratricopeptide (TPR) repeat protein
VLHVRARATGPALAALEEAQRAKADAAVVEFLRAHLLAELRRWDEARAALDRCERAGGDAIAPGDLMHARGALFAARGMDGEAMSAYEAGLTLDPHDATRWLELGRAQLEFGRLDQARVSFTRARAQDDECLEAEVELALLEISRGRPDAGAKKLAELLADHASLRERIVLDPRVGRLREVHGMAALLAPPKPTEPTWVPSAPPWLLALGHDAGLRELGIAWLDADASAAIVERVRAAWDKGPSGTIQTEATLAAARGRLDQVVPVARGPSITTRDRIEQPMLWWLDRAAPDRLWLALSEAYPPFLWIPSGTKVVRLGTTLAEFVPRPRMPRLDLPTTARGFIGYRLQFGVPSPYTGELEPANAHELDRHFAINPFVEAGAWGSLYDDDPWPDELPAQPKLQLKIGARERRVTGQQRGRVWSISRRTRHSRSILTIELHHRDVFVAEVRYRPSEHADVVRSMNQKFGCDFPRDMPVDAVAALLGFRFEGARDLESQLDATSDPEVLAGLLQIMSALRHSDLGIVRLYRRYLDHPAEVVRSTLYNVFVAHNHESLLEEATVTERDDGVRAQIEAVLDEGIAAVEWDPYNDYEVDEEEDEP